MSLFVPQNPVVAWNGMEALKLKRLAGILDLVRGGLIHTGGKSGPCWHSIHNNSLNSTCAAICSSNITMNTW